MANRISAYNRHRKWRAFVAAIRPTPELRVLDVGYADNEFSDTDNYIEKHYPYPRQLTALGLEDPGRVAMRYPEVRFVQYGGGPFPFPDASFDVCWSNAVIEHVGDRARQLEFLREVARVARRAFITTPNRYFPVEVHTQTPLLHFLPKRAFDGYLRLVGKEWAAGSYMNLLSLADMKALLRDAGIPEYRILRNRLMGLPLDFVVLVGAGGR